MVSSASRRSGRKEKPNKNQQSSRSTSRSCASSASSYGGRSGLSEAIDYRVEENSRGELVNKETGVKWPTRLHTKKRYPDYSSSSSLVSTAPDDQFATSPYEMIAIADLDAEVAATQQVRRGRRYPSSPSRSESRYDESSSAAETDESTAKIDSVVFDTAEELARYQRLFRKTTASARSATSLTSVASSTQLQKDAERHYIGVRSRRTVDKKLTPGEFFMYYDKPSGADIPVTIELKIGYMSSSGKIYHFPIQRFECQGEKYYAVMQTDTDVKMFPSIASLVQHYHLFSNVDPASGGLETFGLPV